MTINNKYFPILRFSLLVLFSIFLASSIFASERKFVKAYEDEASLIVEVSDGQMIFTPYSNHAIEVQFIPPRGKNVPANMFADAPAKCEIHFKNAEKTIQYSTGNLKVEITKVPFSIAYSYNDKNLISEENGFFTHDKMSGFRMNLSPNEKLMGAGERVLGMDRRGQRLQLYNRASYGYETHAELMYYSMPMVISSKKYMLAFDNGASGWIDLGATEKDILQFEAVGGRMSYVIVAANNWKGLSENFTEVSGRQPMPPRWALGNIASRFGYHTQKEVLSVANQYIDDDIPVDAIVLDLYWFGPDIQGHMGNLEWNIDSFPNPKLMMEELKSLGIKTVLITEPFILTTSDKYDQCKELGVLGTDSTGAPYHFDFYFGNTALIDIFKPEAKDWFWKVYKKHTLSGVDGWWGDLGEPEVHPDDLLHVNGRADEVHNIYGHEWAKTVYEGFEKDFPNRRPVILMRSGFIGSQRYGFIPWTGDVNRTWGGFQSQVELALQMGMQGLAFMHSDLGGFAGDYKDAELYTRWLQYGVFQPVYRPHAQEEVPSEPIFWDDNTKDIVRRYIKLRYQLMPYNYTMVYQNATTGLPLMRPLFYEDENTALLDEKELYLWGDNFLIAPVTQKGAKTQRVYFPEGNIWIDYWTGKTYEGGQEINVDVELENIPVFVKAGAFIPMVQAFQNTEEYNSKNLVLHYYHHPSIQQGSGMMYEDDGETKGAVENKKYEILNFSSTQAEESLNIKITPKGYDYKGKPESRNIELLVHQLTERPKKAIINGSKTRVQKNPKKKNKASTLAFWDEETKQLSIQLKQTDKSITIEIKQ